MDATPNILIAAPSSEAAKLLEDGLEGSGLLFAGHRVGTMAAFTAALDEIHPDLVLASWKMPDFDGLAALSLCHEHSPESSVIVVADTLEGATALDIAKAGAQDVITRSCLDRLGFSAWRALDEAADRRKRRRFEEELEARAAIVAAERNVAPDGVLVVDRRGEMTSVNQRFVDMWGIPADVVASRSNRRTLDAMLEKLENPQGHIDSIRHLYSHRDASHREEIVLKDGRVFDCFTAPLLQSEGDGQYLGRAWFYHDVTAFHRATSRVREHEELLRALAEQDVAGMYVFGGNGAFKYINPKFASVLGYSADEIVGKNFLEFVDVSERDAVSAQFRDVASGKRRSVQLQSKFVSKGGKVLDMIGQLMSAIYEGERSVVGFALDTTELSRAEAALHENEELYRSVVASMAEGVIVEDAEGEIVTCNASAARILGMSMDQILGRNRMDPAWRFVGPDHAPLDMKLLPSAITFRTGEPQRDVLLGTRRADGTLIWLAVNAEPLFRPGEKTPRAVVVSFTDITPHKLAQEALERGNHALTVLIRANEVLVRAKSEQELLDQMCQALVETGGYRLAWIGFAEDRPAMVVRSMAQTGARGPVSSPRPDVAWDALLVDPGATEAVLRSGTADVTEDIAAGAEGTESPPGGLVPTVGSRILLPLTEGGTTFGVLTLYASVPDAFKDDDVKLLVQLAEDLSYGILALRERVKREEGETHLRRAMEAAVQAIAATLEMRDPYTAGHQREVARLAVAIAHEVGVPEDEIEGIYLAAIVHDIGKIRIPVDILSKPGALTPLEYELMQTHAQIGYEIVKNVDFPWPVADIVLQHHERLDGSGYPAGLKDDQILLGAKILAVADVVQAMSMRRPYRGAYGEAAALAEIEQGRGRLYDPACVDACLKLFREKGFKFG